jgi:predicted esterase
MPFQKRKVRLKKVLLSCILVVLVAALYTGIYFLHLTRVTPAADAAFQWPYYLFTPFSLEDNRIFHKPIHLLVLPNNTGTTSDDPSVHDQSALAMVFPFQMVFGDLDVAILVPTFPRPETGWQAYTHALDRDTLLTDIPDLRRIDLQVEAMIDDATERLSRQGWAVDRKVLMFGFSASGMFANRFTVLHPDRVLAAAVGSPVGVTDLEELSGSPFNLESFRRVPLFFFIGDRDENDSIPYRDGYDEEDADLVNALFGGTPVERWDDAEAIYASIGAVAEFRMYPGVGHTITIEEFIAIREFFARVLAEENP